MRLRVPDLEMALCAISIQNRAEVRKWAVGSDPVGRRPSALRADCSFRGGCAVSTDDIDRLRRVRDAVNGKDRYERSVKIGPVNLDVTFRR